MCITRNTKFSVKKQPMLLTICAVQFFKYYVQFMRNLSLFEKLSLINICLTLMFSNIFGCLHQRFFIHHILLTF